MSPQGTKHGNILVGHKHWRTQLITPVNRSVRGTSSSLFAVRWCLEQHHHGTVESVPFHAPCAEVSESLNRSQPARQSTRRIRGEPTVAWMICVFTFCTAGSGRASLGRASSCPPPSCRLPSVPGSFEGGAIRNGWVSSSSSKLECGRVRPLAADA